MEMRYYCKILHISYKDHVTNEKVCAKIPQAIGLHAEFRRQRQMCIRDSPRRIQAMEMRCYHKVLHISYKDHVTNEEVRAKIQQANGPVSYTHLTLPTKLSV